MASKGTRSQKRKRVESLFIPDVLHLHNIFRYAFDWNVMIRVSKEWKRLAFKYRDQFLLSDRAKALDSKIPFHVLYNSEDDVMSKSIEWLSRTLQTEDAQKKIILHYHKLRYDRYGMKGGKVDVLLQSPFSTLLPSNMDLENVLPQSNFLLKGPTSPYSGFSVLMDLLHSCFDINSSYIQNRLSWRGLALLCITVSHIVLCPLGLPIVGMYNLYTALYTLFSKKFPNIRCSYPYCQECDAKRCITRMKKEGIKINI